MSEVILNNLYKDLEASYLKHLSMVPSVLLEKLSQSLVFFKQKILLSSVEIDLKLLGTDKTYYKNVHALLMSYGLLSVMMEIHGDIENDRDFLTTVFQILLGDYCYTLFLLEGSHLNVEMQREIHGMCTKVFSNILQKELDGNLTKIDLKECELGFKKLIGELG